MEINYIGLQINNWIVTDVENVNLSNRNRKVLICKCIYCNKIRKIRADKRNELSTCKCQKHQKTEKDKKMKKASIVLNEEWEKIKDSDICKNKEEMIELFYKNKTGKFYKKNQNKPFSKENFIFGTYSDVKEYHRKINFEKEIKRIKIFNELKSRNHYDGYITCPYCGYVSNYINACPKCKMSYNNNSNSIYEKNISKLIDYENKQYTNSENQLTCYMNDEKISLPIKDIKAIYMIEDDFLTRVGLTRIERIDLKNQGLIGDFQAIGQDGKTFIIDNIFQPFNSEPYVYQQGNKLDLTVVNSNLKINTYVLLKKDNLSDNFDLFIYKDKEIFMIIHDVIELWGSGDNKAYYRKSNNYDYCVDINTKEISFYGQGKPEKNQLAVNAYKILNSFDNIEIYFNKRYFKNSQSLYELLKSRVGIKEIENEFEDDNTINYKAIVMKEDYETIDLANFLLNKKSDPLTYFGNNFCIYGYPLFKVLKPIILNCKDQVLGLVSNELKDNLECLIDNMKESQINSSKYNYILNKLIKKYDCGGFELLIKLISKYGFSEIFNLNYSALQIRYENMNKKMARAYIDNLYDCIDKSNKPIWKSEYELYCLIKYYYPDAIYQYTDYRFEGQSLDVFVPSINTAFEYQGEQHYVENIHFLDTPLQERKINDKHKKEICSAYNIRLIEWRYDEIITKLVLDEKLKGGIVYG